MDPVAREFWEKHEWRSYIPVTLEEGTMAHAGGEEDGAYAGEGDNVHTEEWNDAHTGNI